jgi:hypothetical protein
MWYGWASWRGNRAEGSGLERRATGQRRFHLLNNLNHLCRIRRRAHRLEQAQALARIAPCRFVITPYKLYLDCELTTIDTSGTIAVAQPTSSPEGADGRSPHHRRFRRD